MGESPTITQATMAVLAEAGEFLRMMRSWIITWIVGTIILFCAGLGMGELYGYSIPIYDPQMPTPSAQIFTHMTSALVPDGVTLVAMNPFAAFAAQLVIALAAALVVTFPLLISRFLRYVFPALYKHERLALVLVLCIAGVLFAFGTVFGYLYILPVTLHFLYGYVSALSAVPFFSVTEFVVTVISFSLISGICFLLPIAMVLLSKARAVQPHFWWSEWRTAVLLFLVVSAILTPDGSGVSMVLLATPLGVLYVAGASISSWMQPSGRLPY